MTNAFEPGDPVLELAALGKGISDTVLEEDDQPWIRKVEQLKIDDVRMFNNYLFPSCTTIQAVSCVSEAYRLLALDFSATDPILTFWV